MSLAQKTAKGIVWNGISFGGGKLLTFVSTLILMRLIAPEAFGPVELALVAITILDVVGDLGVGAALIYQRDDIERASNVTFTISLFTGTLFTVATMLFAPFVGAYFNEPQVTPLLRTLSLVFVLHSLSATQAALLAKHMRFKRRLIPELSRTLAKGVISIVLAFAGWGAWSLVWGQVVGQAVSTIGLWIVQPYRPRLVWDVKMSRTMLAFGLGIVALELLAALQANADYVIVGKLLGTTDLALYRRAFMIANLLIISVCYIAGRVLYPSFAKLNDDPRRLREGYLATLRYTALLTLPMSAGLCAIATLFVSVLFENWLAMAPALAWLAIRSGISTLTYNSGAVYKAVGRAYLLTFQIMGRIVLLIAIVFASAPYGFVGVAIGQVVMSILSLTIDLICVRTFIRVSFGDIWSAVQLSLLASIAMGFSVWLFVYATPDVWPVVRLIVAIGLGAIVYPAALWLLDRRLTTELLHTILNTLRPESKPAAAVK